MKKLAWDIKKNKEDEVSTCDNFLAISFISHVMSD